MGGRGRGRGRGRREGRQCRRGGEEEIITYPKTRQCSAEPPARHVKKSDINCKHTHAQCVTLRNYKRFGRADIGRIMSNYDYTNTSEKGPENLRE